MYDYYQAKKKKKKSSNNRMSTQQSKVTKIVAQKSDCNKTLCSEVEGSKTCCLKADCEIKPNSCVCHIDTKCGQVTKKAKEKIVALSNGKKCDRRLCMKNVCNEGKSICRLKMTKKGKCKVITDCKEKKKGLNRNSLNAQGKVNKSQNRNLGKFRDNRIQKRQKREIR